MKLLKNIKDSLSYLFPFKIDITSPVETTSIELISEEHVVDDPKDEIEEALDRVEDANAPPSILDSVVTDGSDAMIITATDSDGRTSFFTVENSAVVNLSRSMSSAIKLE